MKTLLNKQQAKNIGIRIVGTLAIPVVCVAILLIAGANSEMGLGVTSFSSYLVQVAIIMITTLALSINLGSGRFDFSLGSMATLSMVISAKLTAAMCNGNSASAFVMLLFCIIIGAILGAISGGIYVLLKIPPIVTSLGVTLIFEGLAYTLADGKSITGRLNAAIGSAAYKSFGQTPIFIILIAALALLVIYFIFDWTKFGYDYKALKEGQKVSVNTGIKEIPNAVICYIICGALMGVVGFLDPFRYLNRIPTPGTNFGSISIMFTAFLPMFIGGFIGRYSNDKLGYLLASIPLALLNVVVALFASEISKDGMTTADVINIVNAVALVAFLIYLNNERVIRDWVTLKPLREKLKLKKATNDASGV